MPPDAAVSTSTTKRAGCAQKLVTPANASVKGPIERGYAAEVPSRTGFCRTRLNVAGFSVDAAGFSSENVSELDSYKTQLSGALPYLILSSLSRRTEHDFGEPNRSNNLRAKKHDPEYQDQISARRLGLRQKDAQ